jgi:hypothetical protein
MAARWKSAETEIIKQRIDESSTTQHHPLGKVIKGEYTGYASGAANYGAGEFIYLAGVANTVVGSVVVYDSARWDLQRLCQTRPSAVMPSPWPWPQLMLVNMAGIRSVARQ